MASTYSNLKIQLMATGENSGTWGNVTNTNLGDAIEQALVETATVTFASANVTLTLSDSNSRQNARALRLNLTGTTAGARDLIVPAIQKPYIVNNGTADIITVKVSGQTGVAVPVGKTMTVYNNGTDVVDMITHLSSLTLNVATPLGAASGGTGLNAAGTAGNVLTSNGTAWTSVAAAAFDSGTVMLFGQTAAPTGWTKDTSNFNNSGLRIVTGTASSGGSVDFTTAFASQTPSGTVSVSGSAGNTTLSTPQIPSHTHVNPNIGVQPNPAAPNQPRANKFPTYATDATANSNTQISPTSAGTGGGGSHSHPLSISSSTFSGNAINLAVKYVDVIRATKN
jgi:hypothetical protein